MQEAHARPGTEMPASSDGAAQERCALQPVVSTHVLVPEEQVMRLRELARRTRVAQSEYLREAVEDLLEKYSRGGEP